MASHIVGYPRMGPKREPKLALESFWDGKSIPGYLQKVAADLRESIWNPSVEYFIVPEWGPAVKFSYASHKGVTEYKEAKAHPFIIQFGVDTVPVHSFRITNCGVHDTTQIHTHMCYSNFNDIIHPIIDMDDVITIENSRSDEKLLSVIPIQRLIPAQMKEKRDKGLCFKCDHKWGPGQRCGGPKLFVIKETKGDRDSIDNTEDEIGISPPAISRSPIPKPMMVKITANSCEYKALIDTGSTYNVLHPRVAREVGLKITEDDPIWVRTADGSIMCSEGSCPEFKFGIQGGQFATPAYILQLGGFDVILGMQWLMGLGQIKNWDFASLKMELTQGGKTIQIKGMDTEESEVGCSTDEKLLLMVREGVKYGAGIVYDIHSPRVPSTEEIADRINKMLAVLETNSSDPSLWVNPDCGLKTRKYTEVKPALKNKLLRSQLVSAK